MLRKPEVSNELLAEFSRLKIMFYKVDKKFSKENERKIDSIFLYLKSGQKLEFQNTI